MKNLNKVVKRMSERIQEKLIKEGYKKVFKSDIVKVIYARINDNYSNVYNTKLYKNQSVEYCRTLEFVEEYFQ